ncbi:uncharacterized protein LTR77_004391 [Saxophila tyrrhenica]|uniref:Uncharacterized protein n=1 Tax=Saxophila tyrrhenica TaxID=1690608 RepID=A0AAV9PFJ5_9PEZI|nr:hypothetical protein LTR77_004391 [Saxophila tyrrhenica]
MSTDTRQEELITTITPRQFDSLLSAYHKTVPEKLVELDEKRYVDIPSRINERAPLSERTSLYLEEVVTLVDWKLAHGKFRPKLRQLVQQNDEELVLDITRHAFMAYAVVPKGEISTKGTAAVKAALGWLTKLRGIGPATASLILSAGDPEDAPFFSDELFRWCMCEDAAETRKRRDIKYNVKEYLELFDRVQVLRHRFRTDFDRKVTAVEVEKVAYVLMRRWDGGEASMDQRENDAGKKRKVNSAADGREEGLKKTKMQAERAKANSKTNTRAASPTNSDPTNREALERPRRSTRSKK